MWSVPSVTGNQSSEVEHRTSSPAKQVDRSVTAPFDL
jgi:hypothetical protein